MSRFIGWREKARLILKITAKMNEYVHKWEITEAEASDNYDEIMVKKEAALEAIGYSHLVEKLSLIEEKKDIEKAINYVNNQINEKNSSGHGWDAEIWSDISTILGHHL